MRLALFAMISLGCACGHQHAGTGGSSSPPPEIAEYSALVWVPQQPTYVMTAHTVRDAQRSLTDFFDSFGMMGGGSSDSIGRDLEGALGVNPLSETGSQKLGIDPAGSISIFSEATDPTIAVRLGAPDAAHAFFDAVKQRGSTTSFVIDGVEVTSAKVDRHVTASWAIDGDWLWVHFAFGMDKDATADWFMHAHHRAGQQPLWTKSFASAKQLSPKQHEGLIGYFDSHALLGLVKMLVSPVAKCFEQFTPVGIAGFAFEGDGTHVGGRLALELGPAAKGIAAALLAPPAGYNAIAHDAPLAIQWNLDVSAIAAFLTPCLALVGENTSSMTKYGVRSARVALQTFKPDDKSGTGVIAMDLADKGYLAKQLDQIPNRSLIESNHMYGGLAGHRISIPFLITLDYVLDDAHAIVAVGDGLMDKLTTGTPAPTSTLFALDMIIPGLSADAWHFLLKAATDEWFAKRATDLLQHWHDGHLHVSIDRDQLVVEAFGNRRQ
jgi:hypothetical protein